MPQGVQNVKYKNTKWKCSGKSQREYLLGVGVRGVWGALGPRELLLPGGPHLALLPSGQHLPHEPSRPAPEMDGSPLYINE